MVLTNHFTKYALALLTPNQQAIPEKMDEQITGTDEAKHDSDEHVCPVDIGNFLEDVNDVHGEQHTLSGESESKEEMSEIGCRESEKQGTDESNKMEIDNGEHTKRQTKTDAPVRRPDRTRQPLKRLEYTVYYTIALANALNEEENSPCPHTEIRNLQRF